MGGNVLWLQWLLIGLGVAIAGWVLVWFIQSRRTTEGGRRRRSIKEPSLFGGDRADEALPEERGFNGTGPITPEHHLADRYLVDVEIVRRDATAITPADGRSMPVEIAPAAELELEPEAEAEKKSEALTTGEGALRTLTVALTVLAPAGRNFAGPAIQAAAEELELRLSGHGVFERFFSQAGGAEPVPVFSLAHLRKPGAFDPATLAHLTTPGLLLFMTLPGPLEGSEALDLLVVSADHLARDLGGHLGDAKHQRLTNTKLTQLREQVAEFERRWLAAAGG